MANGLQVMGTREMQAKELYGLSGLLEDADFQ